jgi:hypothetical protein
MEVKLMNIGTIEVTLKIKLNQDISPEVAREFIDEMEYNITDNTGKVSISDVEVIDDDVPIENEDRMFENLHESHNKYL